MNQAALVVNSVFTFFKFFLGGVDTAFYVDIPTINRDAVCTSCRLKKRRNASERVAQSIADWLVHNATPGQSGLARVGACDLKECVLDCTVDLVALAKMVARRIK